MDVDNLRGLATIACMIGFFAVIFWAYAPSRKQRFEDDARLLFTEDEGPDNRHG
ncbi:MAG: cbb3-type cytochrome c oxidase subunit 3 [Pseudomonadota bacterium]